jgi:hexosaminidase
VLAYAAARGIRVVPEFDMPSHTTSWIVAYPRLASNDSVYAPYKLWRTTNVAIDPTRETTYTFLDSLLTEMTALFPDPYFHAGGDENDGRNWRRTPRIVAYMQANKMLKTDGKTVDKHQLQTYFNRRVLALLQKRGKIMIGWDEILGPDLPKETVIQSWRGKKGLNEAVRLGHPALLSNGYYLDLNYSAAAAYAADPLPPDTPLTPAEQKLVLGGEAAMWAEFADSVIIESRIWPRAAAVAERLWSPQAATQNVSDMYRRLNLTSGQLETLGLRHRRVPELLLRQMAGPNNVAPLRTLAEVLEPVKEYKRHFQGYTYTTETRYNRLVDAAPAESEVARRFGVLVDSVVAAGTLAPALPASPKQLAVLRTQLLRWKANNVLLQPLLLSNPALREYGPLSTQLAAVATLLLERLTQLQTGQAAAPAWLAATRTTLDAAQAPAGQAELAVVKAARKLVGI